MPPSVVEQEYMQSTKTDSRLHRCSTVPQDVEEAHMQSTVRALVFHMLVSRKMVLKRGVCRALMTADALVSWPEQLGADGIM